MGGKEPESTRAEHEASGQKVSHDDDSHAVEASCWQSQFKPIHCPNSALSITACRFAFSPQI
jgi:hypothetical protein